MEKAEKEKADFNVPGKLMEDVLNYMATRPLGEVLGLFEQLIKCAPIPAMNEAADPERP